MTKNEIRVDLDDPRAGKIAEVMSNKSCKRILSLLAEREMSESEIAEELGVPLNTVGYNIKKLIESGLIERVGGFLWSVKGKRINKYRLANKRIVISPKISLRSVMPVVGVVALLALILVVANLMKVEQPPVVSGDLKQFNSLQELKDFVKGTENVGFYSGRGEMIGDGAVATFAGAALESSKSTGVQTASDYSETNIQVEGVDEPDIVKNDGKYIYAVSGNKVVIVDAYPAEQMKILSELNFSNVRNIFVNGDKLIVFAGGYLSSAENCVGSCGVGSYSDYRSFVYIYDISDRENPELENEIFMDGNYADARMTGDYVYVISTKYVNSRNPVPPIYFADGVKRAVAAEDVYYFDYIDSSYVFTTITAINADDGEFSGETYLTSAGTIYVSQDNIYLTNQKRVSYKEYVADFAEEVALKALPNDYDGRVREILDSDKESYGEIREIITEYSNSLSGKEKADFDEKLMELMEDFEVGVQKKTEKTVIQKISFDEMEINYESAGEVPGRVLNQFSMDEYENNFRIATTTGQWGENSLNHIYVLDGDLEIVGKVEDLAEGERIFSARFLGNRAYMVTFEAVDPLFVIDLSNPSSPKVLGYLKIPGFSDYLHPYDENHIIGIGKDVDASVDADKIHSSHAVYYTAIKGVKVSLFDVSDVEHPVEEAKLVIGDRGTESDALNEHKAVLFDKERNLLVLPINLAEIDRSKYSGEIPSDAYGEMVWQGAYVLNVSPDEISVRGRITHSNESAGNYFGNTAVRRALYMDDVLYTISGRMIKANDLSTIDEISSVEISAEQDDWVYDYGVRGI